MKEVWKPIEGFQDYQISNQGNLKTLKRNEVKLLSICIDFYGYPQITLCNKGKFKCFKVHRLVSQTFIPNPDNKPQVNHKDGNKQNNFVTNLEWCSYLENMEHAYLNNLINIRKLTENEVLTIHGLYLSGMTQNKISKLYNIATNTISYIITGKTWKHLISGGLV